MDQAPRLRRSGNRQARRHTRSHAAHNAHFPERDFAGRSRVRRGLSQSLRAGFHAAQNAVSLEYARLRPDRLASAMRSRLNGIIHESRINAWLLLLEARAQLKARNRVRQRPKSLPANLQRSEGRERTSPSIPRHVRGPTPASWCSAPRRLDSSRPHEHQSDREALRAVGQRTAEPA